MKFAIGDRVYLRYFPHEQPGKIVDISKARYVVQWADLGMTSKLREESLVPASAAAKGDAQ